MPTENYPMCICPLRTSQENLCIVREISHHTAGVSAAIKNQLLLCTNWVVIFELKEQYQQYHELQWCYLLRLHYLIKKKGSF